MFESIAKLIINNNPYSNVGKLTIFLLSLTTLTLTFISLVWIKRTSLKNHEISKGNIVAILFFLYFLIHPLGFYIYWGVYLNFRGDGQLIFGAVTSFPYSSFVFIFVGILIDIVKNKYAPKNIEMI